jgi:Zn-finger nucleic acid-binding protein
MNMNKKNCPACATAMREIRATSTYGTPVLIEQCDRCGGLWFDDLEIYRIKMGEEHVFDGVDTEKLCAKTIFTEGNLRCPNDDSFLKQFKDPYFPVSLHIDNCHTCGGFWLNRGEFVEFQQRREDIIKKNTPAVPAVSDEDRKFNEQMRQLLASQSDTDHTDVLANFSEFLSTPINPMTNRPLDMASGTSRQANMAIDVAYGIVNIILRLFLK